MRIVTLMENTCGCPDCQCEHGLSLYIETERHRLLADTGASPAFMENADRLGVDLTKVDTAVISHGHYDHAGGLPAFVERNPDAQIYMQRLAGGDYYHGGRYIGIDKNLLTLPQLHLLDGDFTIDEELSLFSNITGRRCYPQSNLALSRRVNGADEPDTFAHEQCLVIREGARSVLISGCAHNGILNILDRYRERYDGAPDIVISGFHMMKKTDYTEAEKQVIRDTARELAAYPTIFYTGHCTGDAAIALMQPIMGRS